MVDTLVKLIINIEEGWGNHFVYDVIPLKKKRPDLFPMVLAAFANHPRWFIDHLSEIETIFDRYDGNYDKKAKELACSCNTLCLFYYICGVKATYKRLWR